MSILIKQHGRLIICCIVSVLLIGILFGVRIDGNTGFIEIAFRKAAGDAADADTLDFADTVKKVLMRSRPEITYSYTKTVLKKAVNINAMFTAADADGNEVPVEVKDILDASGESVLYQTKEDKQNKKCTYSTKEFLFPASGIYVVKVKAEDSEKRTTYSRYKFPVSGN